MDQFTWQQTIVAVAALIAFAYVAGEFLKNFRE